jgi:serine phosphatase RsbU (regulator of sigma subunit)
MMMFQTAVRTALQENPRIEPSDLLTLVNRSLTSNIRRLGENKYMTVSALRRTEDGRFRFSGMHQDLLVFRAKSNRVEAIPTDGTWLGLDDEIGDLMTVRDLDLASGDSLLLYTDGLTEAAKDGQILDGHGLKDVFERHGARPAREILDGVLAALDGRVVNDDVSAVVVKRM